MRAIRNNRLLLFPILTLACFFSAIIIGLVSTWLQAFGYLPVIGLNEFSFEPWRDLFYHPGFSGALTTTLISGWGAPIITLGITATLLSFNYKVPFWRLLDRFLAPLLAVPHAAFAIGLLFLMAPSGWFLRLLSPEFTGLLRPPQFSIMKDTYGIGLMLALVVKEVPFLVLMSLGALSRIDVKESLDVGRSLGYGESQIWLKIVLPQWYPKIRLSVFAILAYSLSVVDIAQILGPTTPSTLAVQIFKWFHDPELQMRVVGAAGSTLILGILIGSIILFVLTEAIVRKSTVFWLINGQRRSSFSILNPVGNIIIMGIVIVSFLTILVLVIWSFTWQWRFPDSFPAGWSLRFWIRSLRQIQEPAWNTISTALTASVVSVFLVVGCLENERSKALTGARINFTHVLWLVYAPLLVPQIAFLFGIQVTLVMLHMDALWISLVWSHLLFVLPYVFLTLGPVYRAYDQRLTDVAITLCGSPEKAFFKIKLPILLRPVLFSLAIGFSVSVAQYLPTLFIGAGRYDTITTEAVNLAGGGDRRIVAVYALCQLITPLLVFSGAILIPRFYHRHQMNMQT